MSKQSIETSRNQFLCMTGKQKLSNAYNSYFSISPNISNSFNINLTQLNKKNQKFNNDWLIATKLKWKVKIVIRTINKLSKSQSRHIVSCRSKKVLTSTIWLWWVLVNILWKVFRSNLPYRYQCIDSWYCSSFQTSWWTQMSSITRSNTDSFSYTISLFWNRHSQNLK